VGRSRRRRPVRALGERCDSAWFRGASTRHEARVRAGGIEQDVRLVETDERNDALDAAYRSKYGRYAGPTARITSPDAQAATLRLVPR